jgi:hypothetical protein
MVSSTSPADNHNFKNSTIGKNFLACLQDGGKDNILLSLRDMINALLIYINARLETLGVIYF